MAGTRAAAAGVAGAPGRVRDAGVLGRSRVGTGARTGAGWARIASAVPRIRPPRPHRDRVPRLAPDAEFERPWTRTIEAAERAAVADARGPDDGYERRPRSTQDRAARREQRRRQLRRRRLVALAISIAIVVLIVVLIVRGCGGLDAAAATAAAGMVFVDRRLLVVPERP